MRGAVCSWPQVPVRAGVMPPMVIIPAKPFTAPAPSHTATVKSDASKWRKYGTKVTSTQHLHAPYYLIVTLCKVIRKANPRLRRDYFRCTVPGCNVKRYVDRAEGNDSNKVQRNAL